MKRILKWTALAALVLSLSSCGLPASAIRSTGRLAQSASSLLGPAATAAAFL